jgi:hypothetical protein
VWRIRDVYPGSRILIFTHPGSRILDPKTAMKDRGKKICCHRYLYFGAINFTKLNYFIFEMLKKKIWANFQRIIERLTQKIVTKLKNKGLGSEIRDPEKNLFQIPDSGVKKVTGSRIRNTT